MAKSDVDAKVKKIQEEAFQTLMSKYEEVAQKEAEKAAEKARKFFEAQEEPDVMQFLDTGKKGKRAASTGGGTGATRKCGVCGLVGARNTFENKALKAKHNVAQHEALKAGTDESEI